MGMKFDADHRGDRKKDKGQGDACSAIKTKLPLYSGGDLTVSENQEVTRHLKLCTGCQEEAASYQSCLGVLSGMASDNQSNSVSPFFWQGIQKEILLHEEKKQKRPWFSMGRLTVAAAAVLAVLTIYFVAAYLLRTEPMPSAVPTTSEYADIHKELPVPATTIPVYHGDDETVPSGKPDNINMETIEL